MPRTFKELETTVNKIDMVLALGKCCASGQVHLLLPQEHTLGSRSPILLLIYLVAAYVWPAKGAKMLVE